MLNKAIVAIVAKSYPDGPDEVVASGYDPALEATWQDESIPWRCHVTRDDGASFDVIGDLRTRRYFAQGETWRDPHVFEQQFLMLPVRTNADYTRVGLGMINRAIRAHWREMEKLDETMFRRASGVPRPGRAGHGELYYARWVERYLDAVDVHGQKYMKDLLKASPGYTANVVRRTINEASAKHGLIKDRPGRGKAGGTMTERCRRILAAASKGEDQ